MVLLGLGRIITRKCLGVILWLLLASLRATKVNANFAINIFESGGDLVMVWNGFLNTAASTSFSTGGCSDGVMQSGVVCGGNAPFTLFPLTGPQGATGLGLATGPGGFQFANFGSGDVMELDVRPAQPEIGVDNGYTSGDPITGSATFTGDSLAGFSIGATGLVGTWTLLDGVGGTPLVGPGSTITLTVGPVSAGASGDPHFKTWVGQRYDYHGACDLVLVSSDKFANGLGLDIHIRTTIRDDWSYISAAALRIGEDIIEVQSNGKYYVNGVEGAPLPKKFGGFHISHKVQKKRPDRFIVYTHAGKVDIRVLKDFVGVNIQDPTLEGFGDAVGLMGSFKNGAWLLRDGETVVADANKFGNEWQVRQDEHKLFVEEGLITWPETCQLPDVTKVGRRRLDEFSITMEDAEAACAHWIEDKDICIQDVLRTGDVDIAAAGAY